MSEYMGYYCKTCEIASGHWYNRADETLSEFYHARRLLAGMQFVNIRTYQEWADSEMYGFLEEHDGHDIALQNEYGRVREIIEYRQVEDT